jgi:hypothetical protein
MYFKCFMWFFKDHIYDSHYFGFSLKWMKIKYWISIIFVDQWQCLYLYSLERVAFWIIKNIHTWNPQRSAIEIGKLMVSSRTLRNSENRYILHREIKKNWNWNPKNDLRVFIFQSHSSIGFNYREGTKKTSVTENNWLPNLTWVLGFN